jgi:uncharacterized protein (TIGR03437 family)
VIKRLAALAPSVGQSQYNVMRKFISQSFPIFLATVLLAFLAPPGHAQNSSTTSIVPVPDGAYYTVDGATYQHATSFLWPQGSKHTLGAPSLAFPTPNTQYVFENWKWSGGNLTGNPVTVTADPSITQYSAVFSVQYALNLTFNSCTSSPCPSPGTVVVDGVTYSSNQIIYEAAGASVTLQAFPNPGWLFVGWAAGTSQVLTGFQNVVTMTNPVVVNPIFAPARAIDFATNPPGLSLLADYNSIPTPNELDWGWGTTHTVGVVSPQTDPLGNHWVFASWSDGGALTHAYTVSSSSTPATLTASFNPGVAVALVTSPQGLNLNIDGRVNWPSYLFTWGTGETHTIQAPAQQTDASGHAWQFSNWSDGGAASHTITVPSDAATIVSGVRLTATYTPMGHLIVNSALSNLSVNVDGTACAVPCDVLRPSGTQVVVTAPASIPSGPGTRQDFSGWSTGASGTLTITLAADPVTVSANYHVMNYLAAGSNPSGSVRLSMQPASPDGYYDSQSQVTVNATAMPGFRFRSWSGDLSGSSPSGTVSMGSPRAVQAMADAVPYVAPAGVANGAGATPQATVAPGSVVSIFGASLASNVFLEQGSPLPQTLGGVTVHVGSRLLPLFFVSPAQINLLLPSDFTPGPQTLTVSSQGQPDVQGTFTVAQDAPGLFPQSINGQNFVVAVHADGSSVTPAAPAVPGETVTVYGTGFGATNPPRPDGFALPASPVYALVDTASVQVGGVTLPAAAAFALPGGIGIDAVQFVIASGLPTATNAQLTLTVNGQASNTLLLPMQ